MHKEKKLTKALNDFGKELGLEYDITKKVTYFFKIVIPRKYKKGVYAYRPNIEIYGGEIIEEVIKSVKQDVNNFITAAKEFDAAQIKFREEFEKRGTGYLGPEDIHCFNCEDTHIDHDAEDEYCRYCWDVFMQDRLSKA